MRPTLHLFTVLGVLVLGVGGAVAQPAADQPVWVTLGTSGGPVPNPLRSQPANALVVGNDIVLFDVGDGVVEKLAQAGLQLGNVKAVVISHLHMDHAAGLEGVIGLRWQNSMRGPCTIYGPPGTQIMVDGIIAAMQPSIGAGYGFDNGFGKDPVTIQVQEIDPTKVFEVLPGVTVQSVENTHYSFSPGSEDAKRYKSYSFRIEGRGRTIIYTGDTGPSDAVTKLAHGADLLVSEVQNLPALEKAIHLTTANVPEFIKSNLDSHLRQHHLSPEDVGKLAKTADVGEVVLTHLGPGPAQSEADKLFLPGVKSVFDGPVVVAEDLERF
jgi:ribonuclease BN (tRNA processing enzyme)